MASMKPSPEPDPLAIEGLDHVFEHRFQDRVQVVTVPQAAEILGADGRAVLKLIQDGRLCAARDKQTRKWLIDLECLEAWVQNLGNDVVLRHTPAQAAKPVKPAQAQNPAAVDADGNRETDQAATLLEKLDTANQHLQAATFRIGYLESQVQGYKEQVNLLLEMHRTAVQAIEMHKRPEETASNSPPTDSQNPTNPGLWSRVCSFLFARPR